jgi:protein-disulfide isomerase
LYKLQKRSASGEVRYRDKVEIVEYGDFECLSCKAMNTILLDEFLPSHADGVRLTYRFFPLPQHYWASGAAEMAACVATQSESTFWALDKYLYSFGKQITEDTISDEVESFLQAHLELDKKRYKTCLANGEGKRIVDRDLALGRSLGVHSTPTIFVQDKRLPGVPTLQQLEEAVERASREQPEHQL